jgi:YggT family protein
VRVDQLLAVIRFVVFGVFVLAVVLALLSWLVRTRRVSPFSAVGRGMRRVTDPVINPIERLVVRRGGNPVQAAWWLVILVAVIGVLIISLAQWVIQGMTQVSLAAAGGPRDVIRLGVSVVYYVLIVALFVRVIGSWIGYFRYTRWMRPAYWLTDWIVEPIRRILPSAGQFDFSPLVAWLLLMVLRAFVLQVLL